MCGCSDAATNCRAGWPVCRSATTPVWLLPWPLGGDPCGDGLSQWFVQVGPVGAHPRLDDYIALPLGGIEIDAADDVVVSWVENGEGETPARSEIRGVAVQVGEIVLE